MHPASESAADRLRQRLSELAQGRTGIVLAGMLGWSPSKVSRIFSVRQVPAEKDLQHITSTLEHPEALVELLELRQAVQAFTDWERRYEDGGPASVQRAIADLEQEASEIWSAHVSVLPALLQTPAYARALYRQVLRFFPDIDVEAAADERMRRQGIIHQEISRGQRRQFRFVISYGALVNLPCPAEDMLEQLHWLLRCMDLSNVSIGIIPQGVELDMTLFNGFELYGGTLVVETFGFENQATGPEAERHAEIFRILMDEAARDDEARELIDKAMGELRDGK